MGVSYTCGSADSFRTFWVGGRASAASATAFPHPPVLMTSETNAKARVFWPGRISYTARKVSLSITFQKMIDDRPRTES